MAHTSHHISRQRCAAARFTIVDILAEYHHQILSLFFVNYCLEFTVYSKCTSGSGARCMVGQCAELQPQVPTALRLGRLPSMAAGGVRDILCHTDDMGSCGSQIRTHERDTLDPV